MRSTEVEALTRAYALAGQVAQVQGQEVLDNLDPDQALREGFERMGAPSLVLRSREAVERLRSERNQAQATPAQGADLQAIAPQVRRLAQQALSSGTLSGAGAQAQASDPVQAVAEALAEFNPGLDGGAA